MHCATGKRKTAIARVILRPGAGAVVVNGTPSTQYFPNPVSQFFLAQPFQVTETVGQYDVQINVSGGGIMGQAQAARHGISKALLTILPALRLKLKPAGLLTRDPREKERKKYGQKGARKKFQYSKR